MSNEKGEEMSRRTGGAVADFVTNAAGMSCILIAGNQLGKISILWVIGLSTVGLLLIQAYANWDG